MLIFQFYSFVFHTSLVLVFFTMLDIHCYSTYESSLHVGYLQHPLMWLFLTLDGKRYSFTLIFFLDYKLSIVSGDLKKLSCHESRHIMIWCQFQKCYLRWKLCCSYTTCGARSLRYVAIHVCCEMYGQHYLKLFMFSKECINIVIVLPPLQPGFVPFNLTTNLLNIVNYINKNIDLGNKLMYYTQNLWSFEHDDIIREFKLGILNRIC